MEDLDKKNKGIVENNLGLDSSKFDILSNLSKDINVQKLIDDGILKISDDVKEYINSIGYSIEDVLRLAGIYKVIDGISKFEINYSEGTGLLEVVLRSEDKDYLLKSQIFNKNGYIFDTYLVTHKEEISGFRSMLVQIATSKKMGYRSINGYVAGNDGQEPSQGEVDLVGYYYWPMLGFRATPDLNVEKLTKNNENILINSCKTLNQLFDLKNDNGKYVGIEFWKGKGFSFDAKFDLSDGSKSLERLNEYILSKKQSNPEKYKDIDVIR